MAQPEVEESSKFKGAKCQIFLGFLEYSLLWASIEPDWVYSLKISDNYVYLHRLRGSCNAVWTADKMLYLSKYYLNATRRPSDFRDRFEGWNELFHCSRMV